MEFAMLWPFVLLGSAAVLVWSLVIMVRFVDRQPAMSRHPISAMRAITGTWHADLPQPRDWYGFHTGHQAHSDAQMARIVSRQGVEDSEAGPVLSFRVRLIDEEIVVVSSVVTKSPDHALPGALIPVAIRSGRHGAEWSVVEDLTPGQARRLLLNHRLDEGLIDASAHDVTSTGRHQEIVVRQMTPTGRIRTGHVEVTIRFGALGRRRELTGFLRPHELAAIRHSGTASGCFNNKGRWALGPAWY